MQHKVEAEDHNCSWWDDYKPAVSGSSPDAPTT
jgi:hypothetical protein